MLHGEVAVITGAASGIGREIALQFAAAGARLLLLDRDARRVEDTAAQIRAKGGEAMGLCVDVLCTDQLQKATETVMDTFGKLDIWCNCAGVSTMNHLWELSEEEWDFNMNVNAKGVFLCVKAAVGPMRTAGYGRIINIASIASLQSDPLLAHYCASKWAVLGFSRTAAVELAKFGITVNCVCPGTAVTEMQQREIGWSAQLQNISSEQVVQNWICGTPVGRLTTAADVARAALFLARRDNAMITGIALPVTGGAEL